MSVTIPIPKFTINYLTRAQLNTLIANGQINENEWYLTNDFGALGLLNGILKGDGTGNVVQAIAGTDYAQMSDIPDALSDLSDDATHRLVTDTEKTTWNAKQDALGFTPLNAALKGVASGVAELDAVGKVPSAQLPSYVDDVLEYATQANFPATGETGKIYVAINTNLTYRWSGSAYVEISPSLALGETSSTAYRGDRGQTAYDHSQVTGNPHGVTAAQVGADASGTAASAVSTHNGDSGAHSSLFSAKQNTITSSGLLKGAGAGSVGAAVAGTDYARVPVTRSKTLTVAGWSNNQQVISDAAIYATTAPGDVRIAQSATDAQFEAWSKAQPRVIAQAIGSITIKITGDMPTINIDVVLEVR